MSREAIQSIARQWGCTEEAVMTRITDILKAKGHIPHDADPQWYNGGSFARKLIVGVSEDGRCALLDANDHILAWLEPDA